MQGAEKDDHASADHLCDAAGVNDKGNDSLSTPF